VPDLHAHREPEAAARTADLLELGVGHAHARPCVDEHELALQRCQPRRLLGDDGTEQRADAELLGALAFQLDLGDRPFDDLDPDRTARDVLRRHDGAAEMKPLLPVDVADPRGDPGEIGLGNLPADEGLPDVGQAVGRNSSRAG